MPSTTPAAAALVELRKLIRLAHPGPERDGVLTLIADLEPQANTMTEPTGTPPGARRTDGAVIPTQNMGRWTPSPT